MSLGSNIEPEKNLRAAVELLSERLTVIRRSRIFATRAVAALPMPDFLNAAVEVETDRTAGDLKFGVLRDIEGQLGRRRTSDKNAPRVIDLDIALYGAEVIESEALGLLIPDPEILTRLHVVVPLADIAPDRVHPLNGTALEEIARVLNEESPDKALRPARNSDLLREWSTRDD